MFDRLADGAIRRPRLILLIAALAVVVMGAVGAGAFGKLLSAGFEDPDSPSSQAREVIEEEFGGESNLVLLVAPAERNTEGGVDSAEVTRAGADLTTRLKGEDQLQQVVSYWDTPVPELRSKDGQQALILAHVKGDDSERGANAEAIIDAYTGERQGLTVRAGGETAVGQSLTTQVSADLLVAESIAVPLTLVLLLLAFGSAVAALLPLAIGLVAVAGTFAELSVLGSLTDVSVFSINLTAALGLGLGIDYALLLVSRFREQLTGGSSVPDAVRITVRTAGRTIVFSAATVAVALSALLIFPQYFLRSFAYAGIGVVTVAAVSALLVVPALLMVLGHRVNSGKLPWVTSVRGADSPGWGRLARTVMRRPALTSLPVLAVLLVAASPLLGVSFGTPDERVLPEDAEARQVATALRTDFDGNQSDALHVVLSGAVAPGPLQEYAAALSRLDGVARVETSAATYTDGAGAPAGPASRALARPDAQRVNVVSSLTPASGPAQDLVEEVRAVQPPDGASALVGGSDAVLLDTKDSIADRLPAAIGLVLASTLVLLFLFTGSVVQPLRAVAVNSLSLAAAVGVMVWIFQEGHLSGLLGFTPHPMDTSMTVLMFCIAFGLSMDYEVFVTSRIKELHDAGKDRETAVADGLGRTGRVVSTAAVLLAVTFFAFGTAEVSFMQMFGLGSGLAILIDAVAIRGVLVPAAMRLLGRAAWYAPKPLRRLHRRFGISESAPEPAPAVERQREPAGL